MNYFVEGFSQVDNKWYSLSEPDLFEQTYEYMLTLSRANPQHKYRVTSTNRHS